MAAALVVGACTKDNPDHGDATGSTGDASTTTSSTGTSTTTDPTTSTTTGSSGDGTTGSTGVEGGSSTGDAEIDACGGIGQVLCHVGPVFVALGGPEPGPLAVGRIRDDSDELDDIVVAFTGDDSVRLLLGDGGLQPTQTAIVALGDARPDDLDVANLDADGDLEIVVANVDGPDSFVSVIDYDGGESLGTVISVGMGDRIHSTVVGDFGGSADLDIALVRYMSSELVVYRGDGNLGFDPPGSPSTVFGVSPDHPQGLGAGDFDGDAVLDLAAGHEGDRVTTHLGDGAGGFVPGETVGTPDKYRHVRVVDVDGDGLSDVLGAAEEPDAVHLFRNVGDGTFEEPQVFATGDRPTWIATGDVNGDGFFDFAVVSGETVIRVWASDDTGQFARENLDVGDVPGAVGFAEINGDGVLDVVATVPDSGELAIFTSDPQPN